VAVAKVCPTLKVRVVQSGTGWDVYVAGHAVAEFPTLSRAKSWAKRMDEALRWLSQSREVYFTDFVAGVSAYLTRAASGDGNYRPPLTLA